MVSDADFAARAGVDPEGVLASQGLTTVEIALLISPAEAEGAGASVLGARQSKSSLLFGISTHDHAAQVPAHSDDHLGPVADQHATAADLPAADGAHPGGSAGSAAGAAPGGTDSGTAAADTGHSANPPAGAPGPDRSVADGAGGYITPPSGSVP